MSSLKPERGKNTRFYYYCLYRSKNTDIFQHSPKRCGQRRLWNACLQLWDEVVPTHSDVYWTISKSAVLRNFAREYLGGVRWKSLSEERKRYESNLWSSMECLCSKQTKILNCPPWNSVLSHLHSISGINFPPSNKGKGIRKYIASSECWLAPELQRSLQGDIAMTWWILRRGFSHSSPLSLFVKSWFSPLESKLQNLVFLH